MRINTASPTIIHPNGVTGTQTILSAACGTMEDGMKSGVSGAIQFVGNIMVTGRRRI